MSDHISRSQSESLTQRTTAIVLAGGRSLRMGADKVHLSIEGTTLLQRAVLVTSTVAARVLIVGATRPIPVTGAEHVADDLPGAGPLAGIVTGLRRTHTDLALVVAVDHPYLNPDALRHCLTVAGGWDAAVPRLDGQVHPLHAVYARNALPVMEKQLRNGQLAVHNALDLLRVRWIGRDELVEAAGDTRSLLNLNTPAEWAEYIGTPIP